MPSVSPRHHTSFVRDAFLTADEIVVKVSDIIYAFLPSQSGVEPADAVREIAAIVDGPAGVAFVEDAAHPGEVDAGDVVVQLHEALAAPRFHPLQTIDRVLAVLESPLAVDAAPAATGRGRLALRLAKTVKKLGNAALSDGLR